MHFKLVDKILRVKPMAVLPVSRIPRFAIVVFIGKIDAAAALAAVLHFHFNCLILFSKK
jgi:hypothetical protein